MIKTLFICAALSMCGSACTTTPPVQTASTANPAPTTCVITGSRIRQTGDDCTRPPEPGKSYSQDDIDRTGQTDAAHALQMLDPSITVPHH